MTLAPILAMLLLVSQIAAPASASDRRLYVCVIYPPKGWRSFDPSAVKKFVDAMQPAVTEKTIRRKDSADALSPIRKMKFELNGCMYSSIPSDWKSVSFIYTDNSGLSYRLFDSVDLNQPLDISKGVKPPLIIEDDKIYLDGGLRAKGDPVRPMLFLLDLETDRFKELMEKAVGGKKQSGLDKAEYLQLQAYRAELLRNVSFEVGEAHKEEAALREEMLRTSTVVETLKSLKADETGSSYKVQYDAAKADADQAKKEHDAFLGQVKAAERNEADLVSAQSRLADFYKKQEFEAVAKRVGELVTETTVDNTGNQPSDK